MSNSTRTVVHLQINNKHEYYGSTSSLYDQHTAEKLGGLPKLHSTNILAS